MATNEPGMQEWVDDNGQKRFNRDFSLPVRGDGIDTARPLPHRISEGGRFIEHPITISKEILELASNKSRTDSSKAKGYHLIPQEPLAELARGYKIGANKYEPRGWEKGMPFSEVIDGLYRHLGKWLAGETHDAEDGQHHMASVAWRAFAIMEYERTHPEMDDVH